MALMNNNLVLAYVGQHVLGMPRSLLSWIMRCRNLFVTSSIVMVLLSGWAVAGCVSAVPPIRLYTGPEKSRSEVATIAGAIESIDGRPIADPLIFKGSEIAYVVQYQPFELLPGRHTVAIRSRYPHAARWMPEYTIEFEAEPGQSYFAFPGSLGEDRALSRPVTSVWTSSLVPSGRPPAGSSEQPPSLPIRLTARVRSGEWSSSPPRGRPRSAPSTRRFPCRQGRPSW